MGINKTVIEAGQVFEYLIGDDFRGKAVLEINTTLKIPYSTVYRILQSWKKIGWTVEISAPTGKGVLWQVSNKMVSASFDYARHMEARDKALKGEYEDVTGNEWSASNDK